MHIPSKHLNLYLKVSLCVISLFLLCYILLNYDYSSKEPSNRASSKISSGSYTVENSKRLDDSTKYGAKKPKITYRVNSGSKIDIGALEEFNKMDYNSGKLSTLDEEGYLTMQALQEAGLHGVEQVEAQKIFDAHRSQMKQIIVTNLKEDLIRTDHQKGIYAFTVESFSDAGIKSLKSMISQLNDKFGESRTQALLSGYSASAKYFQYGTNDIYINVHKGEEIGEIAAKAFGVTKENWKIEATIVDKLTGNKISTGTSSMNEFNKSIGDIFEIDSQIEE